MNNDSKSLIQAKQLLGQIVDVTIDRPLGSVHPKWNFKYTVNYGFIDGIMAPDGEELDAYVLKIKKPISKFTGQVYAVVHRLDDDDDKVIVIPKGKKISEKEIEKSVEFQEKWFKHEIIFK